MFVSCAEGVGLERVGLKIEMSPEIRNPAKLRYEKWFNSAFKVLQHP